MAKEINLVPEIKNDMIKALKLRNLIFFVCIAVSIVAIVVTAILGTVVGVESNEMSSRDAEIAAMSNKINSYSDLTDFLTISDQLQKLSTIEDNKVVISRSLRILPALLPTGADTITVSAFSINLGEDTTISFDAQADAGKEPYIDYNVLEAFKKSMPYMRYDYGRYVDKTGAEIPAYCIVETNTDGSIFSSDANGLYGLWMIQAEGCNPSSANIAEYTTEYYEGDAVVRIWRTPQYNDWYQAKLMTADGQISGVAHFESNCINYAIKTSGGKLELQEENTSCLLVPDGVDGITISDSSNGRGASGLVLRFSANINLSDEYFKFTNKHMLAIGPTGYHNVTDSYVQIQGMFSERAADCEDGDTACKTEEGA